MIFEDACSHPCIFYPLNTWKGFNVSVCVTKPLVEDIHFAWVRSGVQCCEQSSLIIAFTGAAVAPDAGDVRGLSPVPGCLAASLGRVAHRLWAHTLWALGLPGGEFSLLLLVLYLTLCTLSVAKRTFQGQVCFTQWRLECSDFQLSLSLPVEITVSYTPENISPHHGSPTRGETGCA